MTQTEVQCTFSALWCHHTLQTYFKAWSALIIGLIGGAEKTFACKSQECLWQDWYILKSGCQVEISSGDKY